MSNLAAALDVVGSRWALLIVERLLDGPQRYGDLQRDLGVPTNMLATRIRELDAAGVRSRLPLRHNTRADTLTYRGRALGEAINALARWGEELPGNDAQTRLGVVPGQLLAPTGQRVDCFAQGPPSIGQRVGPGVVAQGQPGPDAGGVELADARREHVGRHSEVPLQIAVALWPVEQPFHDEQGPP